MEKRNLFLNLAVCPVVGLRVTGWAKLLNINMADGECVQVNYA